MTEDHARSLLGVNQDASDSEIANAYRRLMQTVHPDVCKGPEAERLAREATDAKQILAARAPAPQDNDDQPLNEEQDWALQEVVAHVLDKTGGTGRVRIVAARAIILMRKLPNAETQVWIERLTELSFWRKGAAQGLWTIQGDTISRTRMNQRERNSRQQDEEPARQPDDDPGSTEAWKPNQLTQIFIEATKEWTAAVTATMLMIVTGCIALLAGSSLMAGDWVSAAGGTIASLSTWKLSNLIDLELDYADKIEDRFKDPGVLLPAIAGTCLMLWGILHGLVWLEATFEAALR